MSTIDRLDLVAALASPAPPALFEALPAAYFAKGHLPGAQQLDHATALAQVRALGLAPHAPIVVYCSNSACQNSHRAAAALRAGGYADVRVYSAGKADWEAAGLPLEA